MSAASAAQDVSQCSTCKHLRSWVVSGSETLCAAFPDGIANEVWANTLDHRLPIDGDNGVQWEPVGSATRSHRDWLARFYDPEQPRDRKGRWSAVVGAADLTALDLDDLLDLFAHISGEADIDEEALRRVDWELGRREGTGPGRMGDVVDDTPERRKLDALVAQGRDYRSAYAEAYDLDSNEVVRQEHAALVDAQKAPGESRDSVVRRLYDETTHLSYLRAEDWTRGNLLSPEGKVANVRAISLFSGQRTRARKYASEELKRFWSEVEPRMNFTEFRAMMLARSRDKKAVAAAKGQGQEQDFGL